MNEIQFVEANLSALQNLAEVARRKKRLEQTEKELKAALQPLMEQHGITSIDNEFIQISYIPDSESLTVDINALRAEMPELYNDMLKKYNKRTKRAAHLRFKAK